jgi:hypothetical protein
MKGEVVVVTLFGKGQHAFDVFGCCIRKKLEQHVALFGRNFDNRVSCFLKGYAGWNL